MLTPWSLDAGCGAERAVSSAWEVGPRSPVAEHKREGKKCKVYLIIKVAVSVSECGEMGFDPKEEGSVTVEHTRRPPTPSSDHTV